MLPKKFFYYALNKPFGVMSSFTSEDGVRNLSHLMDIPNDVYPVGRLDKDSEGLLLLTNDNRFKNKLSDPTTGVPKVYFVQVDGQIDPSAIQQLNRGVEIKIKNRVYRTKPAVGEIVDAPEWLWERNPPVRFRKEIPTSWIKISITEGKNRQVRRMTAKVGFPTLRIIRTEVGKYQLNGLANGEFRSFKP